MAIEENRGVPMNVSREVILDLLPLYSGGEASAASRALVEQYLSLDASLRDEVERNALLKPLDLAATAPKLAEEAELRTLRRTQHLLVWQRRFYALAVTFTVLSLSGVGWMDNGIHYHFLLSAYPKYFRPCIGLAVSCWINYLIFRWRFGRAK